MLVKPSDTITEDLSQVIDEKRNELQNNRRSSLDHPLLNAEHLRSQEDLNMFYGTSQESAWPVVIMAVTKAAVFVGATVVAAVAAVNGQTLPFSSKLKDLELAETNTLSINNLLTVRCHHLT